jgi:hypothetical protein
LLLKANTGWTKFSFPTRVNSVSYWLMEPIQTHSPPTENIAADAVLLGDTQYAFVAVPQERRRLNGWSATAQVRFILALEAMGSVGPAARAAGMGRSSAYRLRERAGAESFAAAWDIAFEMGRSRMFDYAMDRAINGVTTVRVLRGGAIDVSTGPDMKLVNIALRDVANAPINPALNATKGTI